MMPEEFSPEEKLLRLIRGEKKQKDKPAAERIEPPKVSPEPPVKLQGAGYFKIVNSALVAVLVIIIVFFIFDIITSKLKPPSMVQGEYRQQQAARPAAKDINRQQPAAPFSTYADVGNRELFKPLKSEIQDSAASQRTLESAQDKLKDLSLIGIIAGGKPQAVIEDRKIQKTYFLYKGQNVNQMTVEDILEDRVILDFDGEKLELVL